MVCVANWIRITLYLNNISIKLIEKNFPTKKPRENGKYPTFGVPKILTDL